MQPFDAFEARVMDSNYSFLLKPTQFFLLVISTLLIAAGGYIINDIEDVKIDKLNKPVKKQIVGRQISLRKTWILYTALTLVGFFISVYLANFVHRFDQLVIYPAAVLLLYAYSHWFKKMPLIGNLVVSFFCAFVAWIIVYAQALKPQEIRIVPGWGVKKHAYVLIGYTLFAFISTLFREIIKDIEDVVGDKAGECKTLPIVFGIKITKVIVFCVGITLLVCVYFFSKIIDDSFKFFLIHLLISIPILFALYKLFYAKEKKDFAFLSQFAKLIMLSGLIFILVMRL